jgi:hypothetical protein
VARGGHDEEKEVTRRPNLVTNSSLGEYSQKRKDEKFIVLGTIAGGRF